MASMRIGLILVILLRTGRLTASLIEPPFPLPLPLPAKYIDAQAYDFALSIKDSGEKNQWWADYIRGVMWSKEKPQISCAKFSTLSEKKEFPLYPLALLQAARFCRPPEKSPNDILRKIDEYIKNEKPKHWLQVALMEAELGLASTISDEAFVSRSLETSKLEKTKKAKTELLSQALLRSVSLGHNRHQEIETELFRISARSRPRPTSSDWWAVGTDAFSNHEYELAAKAFQKVNILPQYPQLVRRQALDQLRQTYKILQMKKETLKTAIKLWNWDKRQLKYLNDRSDNTRRYLSSGLMLARLHWTEHRNKQAHAVLWKLTQLKTGPALGDVYFIQARMSEEEGDNFKALNLLEEAIKRASDLTQKASYQWSYAWLSFKLNKYDQSLTTLQSLILNETDPGKKSQQSFWLAQNFEALRKPELAKPIYERLIAEDPLGFYSLLAFRELHLLIPKPEFIKAPSDSRNKSKTDKKLSDIIKVDWNLFNWLLSVGELGFARQFLNEEVPLPELTLTKDWQDIVEQYAKAQYFSPIFGRLTKLSSGDKIKLLMDHPEFLFPTPFTELVDDASQRTGLWPEFIFSIMRQESSFDPTSISSANAYGLLQLLPNVARQVAKQQNIKVKELADLLEPSINIPLGAAHLRGYWDKFEGQFILTTAAYNASPETVNQWVKNRFHGNILEFIEDIPYEETRIYVKLVLRNFINYQRLNTSAPALPFPEWCLEGVHPFNN